MEDGHRVTHSYFCGDEWVKLTGQLYEFEDGILCSVENFWVGRQGDTWNDGWNIWK